jgi:S1-C subfamily serine protease
VAGKVHRAVLAGVCPDSLAAEAGLQPSDVITAVAGREVTNAEQATHEVRATARSGAALALRILRDGQNLFLALPAQHEGWHGYGQSGARYLRQHASAIRSSRQLCPPPAQ